MIVTNPKLVYSDLCGHVSIDNINLEVVIVRVEDTPDWTVVVLNPSGRPIILDGLFHDDYEAYAEFQSMISEKGIGTLFNAPGSFDDLARG